MTTPTDAELTETLLSIADVMSKPGYGSVFFVNIEAERTIRAAADRLASLTAELEEVASDRDRLEGMCEEAAEKLDRVSSENAEMHTELERLNLWIIRLREAMGKYADAMNWHCTEFGEYHEHGEKCCKDGWWTRSENGYDIAREALKETNP